MTDYPAPLSPPDCDLRDYPWMPLDTSRLLTSETWMLGSPEEKVAALTLWMKAWHQVPAGSLPNNERMLELLSEAGEAWSRVRDHVLRGFVLCSDGRLYHPVVAAKATEAWNLKIAQRKRTEAARNAKQQGKAPPPPSGGGAARDATSSERWNVTDHPTRHVAASVTENATNTVAENVTGSNRQDQTRQEKKDTPPLRGSPRRSDAVGSRLPPDWQPGPEEVAFAAGLGLDPQRIAASFGDYWHGKPGAGGRKSDWPATWRNWCRRDAERPLQRGPVNRQCELLDRASRWLADEDHTPHGGLLQ